MERVSSPCARFVKFPALRTYAVGSSEMSFAVTARGLAFERCGPVCLFPTYVSETDFAVKLPLRSSKQESSTTSNRTSPVHALISTSSVVRDLPKTLEASPSLQENPGLKMSQAKDPDLGLRSFASSEKLFHVCLTWSSDKDMLTQALMLERAMRVPLFK